MLANALFNPASLLLVAHTLIVVLLSLRVIMKRPPTGVALAWLLLISAIPFLGGLIYLMIGERRIGRGRARGFRMLRVDIRSIFESAISEGLLAVDWSRHSRAARGMDQLGKKIVGLSTVHGSRFQLFSDTQAALQAITKDIDAAQTSVLLEFYIWNEGGRADEVLEAVIRAAQRGVNCGVLIDALGARPWWKGKQPRRLRAAGVHVRPALPVGLLRTLVGRTDLRLHRKIVVIDGHTAWTGSMNLVDPRFFKQNSGVGEWVDAMVRLEGSVVAALATVLISDWILETGEPMADIISRNGLRLVEPQGTADIQVVPSGPGQSEDGLLQMILALINAAESELVLTTPYLVPDDSLLRALRGAAARGVAVRLIVPEKVDSVLTRYASRSYYDDLLEMDIEILLV